MKLAHDFRTPSGRVRPVCLRIYALFFFFLKSDFTYFLKLKGNWFIEFCCFLLLTSTLDKRSKR